MGLLPRFAKESRSNFFADPGDRQSLRVCRFSSCTTMGDSRECDSHTTFQKPSKHLLEFPIFGLLSE